MIVKLLTEHHLEFLILKGGCTGSSESTLVKMSNCRKSYVLAHIPNLRAVDPLVLENICEVCEFLSYYLIWAWQPFLLCNQNHKVNLHRLI